MELQESLYLLAKKNIENNSFATKNRLFNCDITDIKENISAGGFDSIVCNPPFYPAASGRLSSNSEARFARHQTSAGIEGFLIAAAYAVKNRGNIFFIYPADLLHSFLKKTGHYNLELKKLRFIYSYPGSIKGAQLALIQCSKNGGPGVHVAEPLYIYTEKNGSYSEEVEQYYNQNKSQSPSAPIHFKTC